MVRTRGWGLGRTGTGTTGTHGGGWRRRRWRWRGLDPWAELMAGPPCPVSVLIILQYCLLVVYCCSPRLTVAHRSPSAPSFASLWASCCTWYCISQTASRCGAGHLTGTKVPRRGMAREGPGTACMWPSQVRRDAGSGLIKGRSWVLKLAR